VIIDVEDYSHTQPDLNYEAEAERLYRERTGSAYDEYELADIKAAMMFETKDRQLNQGER
jgi:hypothetical protein